MTNKYLTKIALNAQAAREMAKKVGILPSSHSAWKFALRHLRDGRGAPLRGKALTQARIGIGDVSNNAYNKLKSIDRKIGSTGTEVAGKINDKGDFSLSREGPRGGKSIFMKPEDNIHLHPKSSPTIDKLLTSLDKSEFKDVRDLATHELAGPSGMWKPFAGVHNPNKLVGEIHNIRSRTNMEKFRRKPQEDWSASLLQSHAQLQNKLKKGDIPYGADIKAQPEYIGSKLQRIAAPSVDATSSFRSGKSGVRVIYFDHSPKKTRT